ncbi:MAG: ferrous iron transport protein B [Desulfobacteraceae bacterium]|jgi:ferrous iron transport protein B|nr:ferrous iron transport protein B [Desulfobacteraceae bacterium]
MHPKNLTIALAGNPNSGKTTIFNIITGTRQKVGNWPGVTVAKKEGRIHKFGYDLKIIDLPGTYSLTPYSIEEIVARNYVLDERPDVVVDIIDASNLERSLYLATQLRELDCKVLFALNMADLARTRGMKIDADKLSRLLDVPVIFTVGNKNEGIDTLLKQAIKLAETDATTPKKRNVRYSKDIESAITRLQQFIGEKTDGTTPYNIRWTSIKLLEDDKIIKERILQSTNDLGLEILQTTQALRKHLEQRFDDDPQIVMTDERYGFIAGIMKEIQTTSTKQRVDVSRNIDLVLTNRFIGFPIFLFFIWAMFQLTFSLGTYPMDWIDSGVGWLSATLDGLLPDNVFKALLLDGIIAGVGSVIVFLPNILILFFCIALFEDTGYMSRSAFLMDKIMHLIGLHGKSFIPMLMGFGCNVPAIMATRTLESEKDRVLTILITPFMSCSAKLPVYIILAGAFFGARAGSVIFAIYFLGIILSIITGRLFRSTLLKGADAPFVMELPPYRVPMLKSLLIHMWDRSKIFLKKMGKVILIGSIIIWALSVFPKNISYTVDYDSKMKELTASYEAELKAADPVLKPQITLEKDAALLAVQKARQAEHAEKSFIGRIGKMAAPLFAPLGIDWRGGVALLTGFVAKEIVVSTLGVLHAVGDEDTSEALAKALRSTGMTPLSALSMMVFVLLYLPCLASIAAIRRETGSYKWMSFSIAYSTTVAWIMSFIVYQGGKLLGYA